MAHRLTFPANTAVPLAMKVRVEGDGWFYPYDPALDDPLDQAVLASGKIELMAVDVTPIDRSDGLTEDSLWLEAEFLDPKRRAVAIRSREVIPSGTGRQGFGGVGMNLYMLDQEDDAEQPGLVHKALQTWAAFDVSVDGQPADLGVVGSVDISAPVEESEAPFTLKLTLFPQKVDSDGSLRAAPFLAAEAIGMAGWQLEWEDVITFQAPLFSARIERGDSIHKVAKEMAIDAETILRVNPRLRRAERLEAGEVIRLPFLLGGETPKRRTHPSHALTWEEIIRGWTTLN